MSDIAVTFFGVRGSYPVAGPRTVKYGGNSACLQVESDSRLFLFDAGTGLIQAGRKLMRRRPTASHIHLFLTHLHIDHIMGLPFFAPIFDPACRITIHAPAYPGLSARQAVHSLFLPPFSPITLEGIRATLEFHEYPCDERLVHHTADGLKVEAHPHKCDPLLGVVLYKVSGPAGSFVYATDIESPNGFDTAAVDFVQGVDVLIHDSQYLDSDYHHPRHPHRGYGHSTVSMAVENARRCRVGRLYLFHYDPGYSDAVLERMRAQARRRFPATYLARENHQIKLRR